MKAETVATVLGLATSVAGHGYVMSLNIDGNTYPGYNPWVDRIGVQRIVWAFPEQGTGGIGPVYDINSPDVTCRAGAKKPALAAKARAGSKVDIQWSNWLDSHKGPVMTYMGRYPDGKTDVKPQEIGFFKVDENAYDPATRVWGTDALLKNKNVHSLTIPSDIKPGRYIMRHELVALHFGRSDGGAEFYPECWDIEITGNGNATPPTVTIPGAYKKEDPGIHFNLYFGANQYTAPGPKVYKSANQQAPSGPAPKLTAAQTGYNNPAGKIANSVQDSIIAMFNQIFPGRNGLIDTGAGAGGLSSLLGGLNGLIGMGPKGAAAPKAAAAAPAPKAAAASGHAHRRSAKFVMM